MCMHIDQHKLLVLDRSVFEKTKYHKPSDSCDFFFFLVFFFGGRASEQVAFSSGKAISTIALVRCLGCDMRLGRGGNIHLLCGVSSLKDLSSTPSGQMCGLNTYYF